MKAPRAGSKGVPCPVCGGEFSYTVNSRGRDGIVYRRRECAAGHRYSTRETLDRRDEANREARPHVPRKQRGQIPAPVTESAPTKPDRIALWKAALRRLE